jgi:hypothetical protein
MMRRTIHQTEQLKVWVGHVSQCHPLARLPIVPTGAHRSAGSLALVGASTQSEAVTVVAQIPKEIADIESINKTLDPTTYGNNLLIHQVEKVHPVRRV